MTKRKGKAVVAGKYYGEPRDGGPLQEAPPGRPDFVICRRLADFPHGTAPAGAAVDHCARCAAPIAFNPRGPHGDRPRVCMQCFRIQPDPIA